MEKTMNKTIYLVTGAAGFLGGTICRQLIERGEMVRAFFFLTTRLKNSYQAKLKLSAETLPIWHP